MAFFWSHLVSLCSYSHLATNWELMVLDNKTLMSGGLFLMSTESCYLQ